LILFRYLFSYLIVFLFIGIYLPAFAQIQKQEEKDASFGYSSKGDSIEFVFGKQRKIQIGTVVIELEKRLKEINQVNVAGDFNGWNPRDNKYQMHKTGNLFILLVSKNALGKKDELHQFKFVLNHTWWVEPPSNSLNQLKGKDGNTNLTLKY
jgi:hypothetical protein